MNKKLVRHRVSVIAVTVADSERAHGLRDELYVDVLRFIARDSTDHVAADLAAAALKAEEIGFDRWCA